ncbi:hypothetical protein [Streptomyces mexicanus]|uniref:hypothetical protein n=1 Tax=Streptomyces mexicanus TaxID=178566 RepID=UPI00364C7B5D
MRGHTALHLRALDDVRVSVAGHQGVLKVATVHQVQRLSSPYPTYRRATKPTAAKQKEARTVSHHAAVNDLRCRGLAVDGGRTAGR